jgi:hypothetical protein
VSDSTLGKIPGLGETAWIGVMNVEELARFDAFENGSVELVFRPHDPASEAEVTLTVANRDLKIRVRCLPTVDRAERRALAARAFLAGARAQRRWPWWRRPTELEVKRYVREEERR